MDSVLYCHCDCDGTICRLNGKQSRFDSLADLCASRIYRKADAVKLLGTADNAALILAFAEDKRNGRLASVQVASPRYMLRVPKDRLLSALETINDAESVGGFHEITNDDIASYRLIQYALFNIGKSSRVRGGCEVLTHEHVFHGHPVLAIIKFMPELINNDFVRVLAVFADPRWHVDMEKPDSFLLLYKWFHVTWNTMSHICTKRNTLKHMRCKWLYRSWARDYTLDDFANRFPGEIKTHDDRPGYRVQDFLLRFCSAKLNNSDVPLQSRFIHAATMTSRLFLRFIHQVWTRRIAHTKRTYATAECFVPESFFRTNEEISKFLTCLAEADAELDTQHDWV